MLIWRPGWDGFVSLSKHRCWQRFWLSEHSPKGLGQCALPCNLYGCVILSHWLHKACWASTALSICNMAQRELLSCSVKYMNMLTVHDNSARPRSHLMVSLPEKSVSGYSSKCQLGLTIRCRPERATLVDGRGLHSWILHGFRHLRQSFTVPTKENQPLRTSASWYPSYLLWCQLPFSVGFLQHLI